MYLGCGLNKTSEDVMVGFEKHGLIFFSSSWCFVDKTIKWLIKKFIFFFFRTPWIQCLTVLIYQYKHAKTLPQSFEGIYNYFVSMLSNTLFSPDPKSWETFSPSSEMHNKTLNLHTFILHLCTTEPLRYISGRGQKGLLGAFHNLKLL